MCFLSLDIECVCELLLICEPPHLCADRGGRTAAADSDMMRSRARHLQSPPKHEQNCREEQSVMSALYHRETDVFAPRFTYTIGVPWGVYAVGSGHPLSSCSHLQNCVSSYLFWRHHVIRSECRVSLCGISCRASQNLFVYRLSRCLSSDGIAYF